METQKVRVDFVIDTETLEYVVQDAIKRKKDWRQHIADILRNEKEKANRRPKIVVEKE